MKTSVAVILLVSAIAIPSQATVISQWTFETSQPTTSGPIISEVGSGSASAVGLGTVSSPAGNGSAHSFSGNTWDLGDYFQFAVSTIGYSAITVAWDQVRSSTGPATFDLTYSFNGSTFFVGLDNYAVATTSWSSATHITTTSFSADLSSISGLDNAPMIYLRVVADSDAGGTTGTSRIDNFTVSGTPIQNSVPDSLPTGFAAFALVSVLLLPRHILKQKPALSKKHQHR